MVKKAQAKKSQAPTELKLDLGCGINKKEGFVGVDVLDFEGVDVVADLRKKWPWKNDSVDEVHCSHFIEHLTSDERCHFMNELYRVLKPDAKATIVAPHWGSNRAYGDPTHVWPPVSEMFFFYLKKDWRDTQAPHTNGKLHCNFDSTWGYSLHPELNTRNQEYQQFAVTFYKEAVTDIIATLIKR